MLQELRSYLDDKLTGDTVHSNYAKALYEYGDEFDQFVSKTSENAGNISVHSYFLIPNVGIAHCLLNHWAKKFSWLSIITWDINPCFL